jgi:hypothetical protein
MGGPSKGQIKAGVRAEFDKDFYKAGFKNLDF